MAKKQPQKRANADIEALRARLEEAESTLTAIRLGHVEALVVSTPSGPKVYAIEGADHRYRRLVETMNEGAVLVGTSGIIVYANAAFAGMVGARLETVIGRQFQDFVARDDLAILAALLRDSEKRRGTAEMSLCSALGVERPVYLSATANSPEEGLGIAVIVTDLTQQKRNEEIVASERLANAILEQGAEPIIVCDVDAVIFRASHAARTLAGDTVLRRDFHQAFPLLDGAASEQHPVTLALRGEVTTGREVTAAFPGQAARSFLCTAAPLLNDQGQILGCVVALIDITERKRLEAARADLLDAERAARTAAEHARKDAEMSSRAKDQFLATVSHELRTPLNAMLGWTRLLAKNTLSEDKRQHAVDVIQRNVVAQVALVEDLLDVSRIVSGQMRLEVQSVEPVDVVRSAIESVKPAIEAKRIRLEVILDPQAGPVLGDGARLQQVVWNLLSNAVKFTPRDGKVRVLLRRFASAIEIVVSDSGQGIASEFLPYVFDRFRQADATFARRHGGLGLGLAIARHLVELHGGTIEVTSEGVGLGSTFVVRLPQAAAKISTVLPGGGSSALDWNHRADLALADLRGLRVLVVDDDADSRDLLVSILEKCEASPMSAASAGDALTLITETIPDVLVSDIGMPEVDGYELIRRVRSLGDERAKRLPAVALTAYARSEDRRRALAEGFQIHLAKPIEPAEFAMAIASVFRSATYWGRPQ